MMRAYWPLFSLSVKHTYFSGGLCQGLNFIPTPQTRTVFDKANLLMKRTPEGIGVFYDQGNREALKLYMNDPDEPLQAAFKAFADDARFKNYSDLKQPEEDSILYFDNQSLKHDADGKYCLHEAEYVSDADFERLESPRLEQVLDPKDRLVKPEFVVTISLAGEDLPQLDHPSMDNARDYYLRFKARETIWKYYLLGKLKKKNSYIVDLDNETEFEETGPASLPGNRTALTFRSKQKLPLREKSGYRFQLKEKDPGGGKVLIKRLPVASANQLEMDVVAGKEAIVSEIFINC